MNRGKKPTAKDIMGDHCPELTRSKICGLEISLAANIGIFYGIYPGDGFVNTTIRGTRKIFEIKVMKS